MLLLQLVNLPLKQTQLFLLTLGLLRLLRVFIAGEFEFVCFVIRLF